MVRFYMTGLPPDITEEALTRRFKSFGTVTGVEIRLHKYKGPPSHLPCPLVKHKTIIHINITSSDISQLLFVCMVMSYILVLI